MYRINDIKDSPNLLAKKYSKFNVSERLLLTGHSHQAWPDAAEEAHLEAFSDAAKLVDKKWEIAAQKAQKVKEGYKNILKDRTGNIALASNTHDLVIKFLSALPLKSKPKILTTDGEFHTLRRQLDRLAEENIMIEKVPTADLYKIPELLIDKIDSTYAAVIVSAVFFRNSGILPYLDKIAERCNDVDVPFFVDAYHALNVIPFTIVEKGLENAFVIGGGYKYMQLGEGNCFMRFPGDCDMRPAVTGWFSEFSTIGDKKTNRVDYGVGDDLFAGSTYDPVSHYRAAAVLDFFAENDLNPEFLREISLHQVALLRHRFIDAGIDPKIADYYRDIEPKDIAGFFTVITPHAEELNKQLFEQGIYTDFRAENLRFGPAPYMNDAQLQKAMSIFLRLVGRLDVSI